MASILMHLAITKKVADELSINDKSFLLGAILPDFVAESNGHFRENINGTKKITINLFTALSELLPDKDNIDMLSLGYYIHLYQDYCFRRFLIEEYHIQLRHKNIKQLHCDFEILNRFVINRYSLNFALKDWTLPEYSMVYRLFAPDIEKLQAAIKKGYTAKESGLKTSILDEAAACRFIEDAAEMTKLEIESILRTGKSCEKELYYWQYKDKSIIYKLMRNTYRYFLRSIKKFKPIFKG